MKLREFFPYLVLRGTPGALTTLGSRNKLAEGGAHWCRGSSVGFSKCTPRSHMGSKNARPEIQNETIQNEEFITFLGGNTILSPQIISHVLNWGTDLPAKKFEIF